MLAHQEPEPCSTELESRNMELILGLRGLASHELEIRYWNRNYTWSSKSPPYLGTTCLQHVMGVDIVNKELPNINR